MATGASTADLAIILVDATKACSRKRGVTPTSLPCWGFRACLWLSTTGLARFSRRCFRAIGKRFPGTGRSTWHPFDSVRSHQRTGRRQRCDAERKHTVYSGPTLLEHLETVEIHPLAAVEEFRFPVQYVVRPDANFRGLPDASRAVLCALATHFSLCPLDAKLACNPLLPSTRFAGSQPGMSVTLKLEDEIDLSRGGMLVSPRSHSAIVAPF